MSRLKRVSLWFVGIVLLLLLLVLIFSPLAARIVLNDLLEAEAVQLSEDSTIRLNPFRSSVSIDQLELVEAGNTPLKLETLEVRYELWRILFSEAHISRIYLKGLHLQSEFDEETLKVAGINLADRSGAQQPASDAKAADAAATTDQPAAEDGELPPSQGSGGLAYTVPQVIFEDLQFDLNLYGQSHVVIFDSIVINRSIYRNQIADSELSASGTVDGAALAIEAVAHYENEGAHLELEFQLTGLNSDHYQYLIPEPVGDVDALIDVDLTVELERAADGHLSLEDAAATIAVQDLNYSDEQLAAGFKSWKLEADDIDLSLDAEGNLHTQVSFSTLLDQLVVSLVDGDELVALEELSLARSLLDFEEVAINFSSPGLKLTGLNASRVDVEQLRRRITASLQNTDGGEQPQVEADLGIPDELPALLSLGHISLSDIALETDRLSIDTLTLGGGEAHVLLADNGELMTLADTSALTGESADQDSGPSEEADAADAEAPTPESEPEAAVAAQDEAPAETAEAPFLISLNKLELDEPISVNFLDESQQPKFQQEVFVTRVLLEGVDNSDPQNPVSFDLALDDGQYFKLGVTGDAKPFTEAVNARLKAEITEFSLPTVSSYLAKYLDFEIKAGQLDTVFEGSIVDSVLDAEADIEIRAADFSAAQAEPEDTNVIGQAAIPLNVALGMLKDSKGNINLRIPVDGSLDDPSFGMEYIMGLVIQKAVMAQTKNYLMNTFVPYASVISVAMAAGSFALKVRFEDLPYQPGQVEPAEQQQEFVQQLSQLMQDKPEMQVKVCPVVTPGDLAAAAGTPASGKLSEEQKIQLDELASQRAASFKDAVLQQSGVESARLLLCAPEVDFGEAGQSRMKFSV